MKSIIYYGITNNSEGNLGASDEVREACSSYI
jgi:hypothetical protein